MEFAECSSNIRSCAVFDQFNEDTVAAVIVDDEYEVGSTV